MSWAIVGLIVGGIVVVVAAEIAGIIRHDEHEIDTISELWWALRDRLGPFSAALALPLAAVLSWTFFHLTFEGRGRRRGVEHGPASFTAGEAARRQEAEVRGAMGTTCAAHNHRELVPLERHHVWPLGEGGPDTSANIAVVCSNAHSATHDLLAKMLKGPVPWTVRRRYGLRVRGLAKRGYDQILAENRPSEGPGAIPGSGHPRDPL